MVPAGRTFPLPVGEVGAPVYNDLVVLVVQHDDEQAVRAIESQFEGRGFPRKMTWDVGQTGVYQPPEEIMSGPGRLVGSQFDIWSCLRLRGLGGRLERYEGGLGGVNRDRIERDAKSETTVGTWICNTETVLGPRIIASSLVVLVFRAEDRHFRNFASRLEVYFNKRRSELVFDAMAEQPLYIYIALYQCFNSFTTFFYQYQGIYEEVALHQEKRITSVFSRSFRLNKTLIHMSYCQEDILMHKTMLMKIGRLIDYVDPPTATTDALIEELEGLHKDLNDFEDKYKFFSERFKAALDLEFSLSSERLNWIMMLFTALTVLFTPIAFVAAVFSIIDSDPVWFLISGSAVLCISIAICLWAFTSIQGLGHSMTQGDLRSLLHKLPYQGPGYRRPKGPDGGGPPPHDPGPGPPSYPSPHGPMAEGRMSGHESGRRPSPSQPLPPPSPPPRPPVSSFRPPVGSSQWRPHPGPPPPIPVNLEREHWGHHTRPKHPPQGHYRRVPPPAGSGVHPGPSISVAHAPSALSYSSGDSSPEEEDLRRRESRLHDQEVRLREREVQLREQEARLRVEVDPRPRRDRAEQVRVRAEADQARAQEQIRRSEEARRVLDEGLRRQEGARGLGLQRPGRMPE